MSNDVQLTQFKAVQIQINGEPQEILDAKENGNDIPRRGSKIDERPRRFSLKPFSNRKYELVYNIGSYLQNKALQIAIFFIWLAINIYFFYDTYTLYCDDPIYFYTSQMLGSSLCISRATAYLIYINGALVLIPMCRGVLAQIRTYTSKYLKGVLRRLFDHSKGFHIYIGYTLVISSIIHTIGHLCNNYRLNRNYSYKYPALNLRSRKEDMSYAVIFGTVPGVTGIIMLAILLFMTGTAFKVIRQKRFELFWYSHHLYIVFFALYMAHGFGDIIKFQTNLDAHKPGCDYRPNGTNPSNCREPPKFTPKKPEAWKWCVGPLALFLIDKGVRWFRRQGSVEIRKIIMHEGKVVELRMRKKGFQAKPGQYVRLKSPDIARFEWHPFTLTKVPTEADDEFWVQIKVAGQWTEKLSRIISPYVIANRMAKRVGGSSIVDVGEVANSLKRGEDSQAMPDIRIKVEGPFGGPCQDVTRYRVGVCVGAGIGVTPFAAVLNFLRDTVTRSGSLGKTQRIYFIWVCRTVTDFTWFVNILYDVYLEFKKANEDLLICKLFVTRGNKISEQDASIIAQKHEWQRTLLKYGRPKWKEELADIGKNHERERIGVFFCGPTVAGTELNEACLTVKGNDNVFVYHKETLG